MKVKGGEQMDRLQQLYIELQPRLFTYFYLRTSNKQVAEDLTQDVFYEASKSIHLYRGAASLSSWLYAIANNLLKKYYRSKKYEKSLLQKLERPKAEVRSTEYLIEQKEEVDSLHTAIQQLDERSKDIVLMRIYGELSFKEIGEVIGKSENYVRVQFHRLKLKLKLKGKGER